MKKLLKKTFLTLMLAVLAVAANSQVTITYDHIPANVLVADGSLSSTDQLVFTVDNIPNGNTTAITANVRVYLTTTIANVNKVFQSGINIDITDSNAGTWYTFVESAGTVAGTTKRVFTVSQLAKNTAGGGSGDYADGSKYDVWVRVLNDPIWAATKDFISASTMTAVTTLGLKDFNISASLYPNPVQSILNIASTIDTKTYKIVNMLGVTVKDVEATGSVDVSNLAKGIYILVTDAELAKFIKK